MNSERHNPFYRIVRQWHASTLDGDLHVGYLRKHCPSMQPRTLRLLRSGRFLSQPAFDFGRWFLPSRHRIGDQRQRFDLNLRPDDGQRFDVWYGQSFRRIRDRRACHGTLEGLRKLRRHRYPLWHPNLMKCVNCPLASDARPCHGTGTRPHFCEWAAEGKALGMIVDMADMPPAGQTPAPSPPGLLTRAANFAAAVFSHVAAGLPILSPEATAARLAVCAGCPLRVAGGLCAVCGCVLAEKARWADQNCPERRWPEPPVTA